MNRTFLTTALLLLISVTLFACGSGGVGTGGVGTGGQQQEDFQQDLRLGTGSVGGTYFPLGQEIATVLSEHVEVEGFNVSSVESGASVENMAKISAGEFQLGMTVNGTAQQAFEGVDEFEDRPVKNFGLITQIYPEVMHVVTREATGVGSIEDLEGARVAIGPPGSATQDAARRILAAHGLEEGDYQAFEEDFGDAAGRLQDGNLDASFAILGSPASSVDQLQATTGDVLYLPIEGEALQRVTSETFYEPFEIPADAYGWLGEPVSTVSAYAVLVGSTNQVSEDVGYEITKALMEHSDEISHPQAENISKETALRGRLELPLHPGAERYYREAGLLDE